MTNDKTNERTSPSSERETILNALAVFIRQKPGMEPGNYDRKGYNSERRQVHRDLQHAERLLAAVRWRDSIGADQLKEAFKRAFSGRLSWIPPSTIHDDSGHPVLSMYGRLDYCTGQYFPTEYRKAVCAVLASALWGYWWDGLPEPKEVLAPTVAGGGAYTEKVFGPQRLSGSAYIRKSARKEFGLEIAKRYFDYRVSDYK